LPTRSTTYIAAALPTATAVTVVARVAQRTAKNTSASGTMTLSISASMYFSMLSSRWMPNASLSPAG
jgi:hypothetical protein